MIEPAVAFPDALVAPRRRPGQVAASPVADYASGSGSAAIGPKSLDGLFCFGADTGESLAKAAVAKDTDDHRAQILGMLKAADALTEAGRLPEAGKEVEAAFRMSQQFRLEEGRAGAMVVIAKIYARQGELSTADQLDEAQDLALEAQEKFQKFGSKRCEAAACLALAAVKYALKQHDEGDAAAKEAQALLQAVDDAAALAEVYLVVAEGCLLHNDTRRASRMVSQARSVHARRGDRKKEAECVLRLAQIDVKAGQMDKAMANFTAAQGLYRDAGYFKGEASVLSTVRECHLNRGSLAQAIETSQRIVTLYHHAGDKKMEGASLLVLAELLIEKDQLDLAEKVGRAAMQVAQSSRDGEGVVKATELLSSLKNAVLKQQIRQSIDTFAHTAHYPVSPVVDFALNQQVPAMFAAAQKGL